MTASGMAADDARTTELDSRTAEFRAWLAGELATGRSGTRELQVSISTEGRVVIKFRPAWRPVVERERAIGRDYFIDGGPVY